MQSLRKTPLYGLNQQLSYFYYYFFFIGAFYQTHRGRPRMGSHSHGPMLGLNPMVHHDGRPQKMEASPEGGRHHGRTAHSRGGRNTRRNPDRSLCRAKALLVVLHHLRQVHGAVLRFPYEPSEEGVPPSGVAAIRNSVRGGDKRRRNELGMPGGGVHCAPADVR